PAPHLPDPPRHRPPRRRDHRGAAPPRHLRSGHPTTDRSTWNIAAALLGDGHPHAGAHRAGDRRPRRGDRHRSHPTTPAMTRADALIAQDKRFVWPPFTQMGEWLAGEPLVIYLAEGNHRFDVNGRRHLDGVS